MRFYIAGKWGARERLRVIAEQVRATGHEVTSSWLLPTIGVEAGEWNNLSPLDAKQSAILDLKDIANSDALFLDTIDESHTGGREVEYGFALGLGKIITTIGPKRNGFHHLCPGFDTWGELLAALEKGLDGQD